MCTRSCRSRTRTSGRVFLSPADRERLENGHKSGRASDRSDRAPGGEVDQIERRGGNDAQCRLCGRGDGALSQVSPELWGSEVHGDQFSLTPMVRWDATSSAVRVGSASTRRLMSSSEIPAALPAACTAWTDATRVAE